MENNPSGFLMTVAQAEEFYKRCIEREAITYEERLEVLKEMVNERRAFPQTEEQIKKRVTGKNVLKVKVRKNDDDKL